MKIQVHDRHQVQDQTLASLRQRLSSHLEDWALLAIQLNSPDAARCQHAAGSMFLTFRPLHVLTRQFLQCCDERSCRTPRGKEILASLDEIRHLFRGLRRGGKVSSNKDVYHQLRVAAEDLILLLREELAECGRIVAFPGDIGRRERSRQPAAMVSSRVIRFPAREAS